MSGTDNGVRSQASRRGSRIDSKCKPADELIFVPSYKLPKYRRSKLAQELGALSEGNFTSGDEEPFLVESLLETEAVTSVLRYISEIDGFDGIMIDNSDKWSPPDMPPVYKAIFEQYVLTLRRLFGEDFDEAFTANDKGLLRWACDLLSFFLDLACAHPSEDLLKAHNSSKEEYEPGLKLVRLFHAFQRLPEASGVSLLDAITDRDLEKAENYLLQECTFPYLSSQEIYQDWARVFENMASEENNYIINLRHKICKRRIDEKTRASCAFKYTGLASVPWTVSD